MTHDDLRTRGIYPCPERWDATYAERVREAWRDSGLPMLAFARLLAVPASLLKYWLCVRGRPRTTTSAPRTQPRSTPGPSLPLREFALPTRGPRQAHYELRISTQIRLRVPPDFDAPSLRRLLALLAESAS